MIYQPKTFEKYFKYINLKKYLKKNNNKKIIIMSNFYLFFILIFQKILVSFYFKIQS
jgi:hypothetical protein